MRSAVMLIVCLAVALPAASSQEQWACGWRRLLSSTVDTPASSAPVDYSKRIPRAANVASTLSGTLTDAWTKSPVAGVDVYVDNHFCMTTAADGRYAVPVGGTRQLWLSDPQFRYHDFSRFLDVPADEALDVPMIPVAVDFGLMKCLANPSSYPILRRWDLPIRIFVNDAGCCQACGGTAGAESIRVAMREWESLTGMLLFQEVPGPLAGGTFSNAGINVTYQSSPNLGEYIANLNPADGTPVLGVLNLSRLSSFVALHELGHALGLAHTASHDFLMHSGTIPCVTGNPFPDYRMEAAVVRTFFSLPPRTNLSCYAPGFTGFTTPDAGVRWTLDELVMKTHGSVTGRYPAYVVHAPLEICDRDTVTAGPGTHISVMPSCEFLGDDGLLNTCWNVRGTLLFRGTPDSMIVINSSARYNGAWAWIGMSAGASLEALNVEFDGAWRFITSATNHSGVRLHHCLLHNYGRNPFTGEYSPALSFSGYTSHPDARTRATEIVNCTFDPSSADIPDCASIQLSGSRPVCFMNNILLHTMYGITQDSRAKGLIHSYNLFYGVQSAYSPGAVDPTESVADPLFVPGTEKSLYLLTRRSPAVDSGNPDPAWNDPDGSRGDIGYSSVDQRRDAYEESPRAEGGLPAGFLLHENFPNPCNGSTDIQFELPVRCFAELNVYNALGQEVAVLFHELLDAGRYDARWGGEASSGMYFIRMVALPVAGGLPRYMKTGKMVVVK